jgi:purine nucleoside phosphorylase
MLAIVGGTGLNELPGLEIAERSAADTPFGTPSGGILCDLDHLSQRAVRRIAAPRTHRVRRRSEDALLLEVGHGMNLVH